MSVDLVRIVDSIHRDKNIPKEILFEGIESALATAAKKHYPEALDIQVTIDQETGKATTIADGEVVEPPDFGRIAAQTAKQVIIQKIREAERDSLFDEFGAQRGELITGTVQRFEGGAVTVNLGKTDAILPRGDQIPGDDLHPGERVRAIIKEVKKAGQRVKIILSRTHPDFVRRLFELEIPEIADGVIQIRALAREAGFRSKVAVTSIDSKVDAVGACVGVRGTRIKNIVDELGGERIDIVRWNDSYQVLIPNALQPATVEEVMLCNLLGRAIVLVGEDQLSLAIGRRGQNVRLASKLVGCDIEIMTAEDLDAAIDRAVAAFTQIEGMTPELAERLVEHGVLSYDDLSVMEPDILVETIEGLDPELAESIIAQADALSEQQTEEIPRRKPRPAPTEELAAEGGEEAEAAAADREDDLEAAELGEDGAVAGESEEAEETHGLRDLDLADETSGLGGHEVTFAPPEDDQNATERIVSEAVAGEGIEESAETTGETD
jgi:N utilization substance protein A